MQTGHDGALIADISLRQIVVAATIPTSYDTAGLSTFLCLYADFLLGLCATVD